MTVCALRRPPIADQTFSNPRTSGKLPVAAHYRLSATAGSYIHVRKQHGQMADTACGPSRIITDYIFTQLHIYVYI